MSTTQRTRKEPHEFRNPCGFYHLSKTMKFILMNKYSTFSRLRQATEKYKNTKILK